LDAIPRVALATALAAFFVGVQFYTSLQALSPTPHVGFSFVDRLGAAVLVAVIALGALVCAVALVRDGAFRRRGASRAMLAAWIGAAFVSALLGLAPLEGLQVVATMLLAAFFHLALVRWYAEAPVAKAVVLAYLIAGSLAALTGILMVWLRVPLALYAETHGRAAGFFLSANQFAEFLDLFVFVALGIALGAPEMRLRRAAATGAALGVVALVLTFSRESWSGVAIAAIWLAAVLRQRKLAFVSAATALVLAATLALRPFPHHDPSDTFSRLWTLEGGLRVVALFPLTGVGPVEYWRIYPAIRPVNGPAPGTFGALHPHDVYLSLAGETGLAGLAAALLGWLWFARELRRRLARAPERNRRAALAVCAGLIAILWAGLFDSIGVVQMTFVWIPYTALALALAADGFPPVAGGAA